MIADRLIEGCRNDPSGFRVHGDNPASFQQATQFERLADGCRNDHPRARIASAKSAQNLKVLFLFEVERSDYEVGSLDHRTGLKPVEGATRRRISPRVGASADPDRAACATECSSQL